jgi:hypothetical protein
MTGGVYDSRNFEQKQLKMPEIKTLFILIYSSQNMLELYQRFSSKNAVLGGFTVEKVKASTSLWWCFCVFWPARCHI